MQLTLRPAVPGDETIVLFLIRELAAYEKLSHKVEASKEMIGVALFGEHPRVFCEIAEIGGEVAGFSIFFHTFSTFRGRHGLYLEDLFVRAEHRGRGIGRELIASLARRCVREGLGRLEWSVLDWNEPALGFYRGLGARPVDGWLVHRLDGEALTALAGRAI